MGHVTPGARGHSRRDVLRWSAGGLAAVAVGTLVGTEALGTPWGGSPGAAASGTRPISMAMHLHGSASEGRGSMAAHLQQATASGVDVVWWTDHDFRHQALGYPESVGFDAEEEPRASGWEWRQVTDGSPLASPRTEFVAGPRSADDPGRAMRVAVTGEDREWSILLREATAENSTYTRTLADTRLELDVLLERGGPDAMGLIRVQTSFLPASGGREAGYYSLEYRLGSGVGRSSAQRGRTAVIVQPVTAQQWQRVRLDPQADVERAWPDLVSGDLGLCVLQVGVQAREGTRGSIVYDRLRIQRSLTDGDRPLAAQRGLMKAYADRYPDVVQHQGSELSLVRHLNAYGGDLTLPDYGPVKEARKDSSIAATREMVAFVHDRGGVVAMNHPLKEEKDARVLTTMLIETQALGADLIEIGVQDRVPESIDAFDAAARNAVFVTATGTSDDHLGKDWLARKQRWITSVWAKSSAEKDLLAALLSGRGWFWDLGDGRGSLDLSVHDTVPMGGVVVSEEKAARVVVDVPDLPDGRRLALVRGVVDLAGAGDPKPRVTRSALSVQQGRAVATVDTAESCYVRVEVLTSSGSLAAFSNPVWLLREEPPGGIPDERRHSL